MCGEPPVGEFEGARARGVLVSGDPNDVRESVIKGLPFDLSWVTSGLVERGFPGRHRSAQ